MLPRRHAIILVLLALSLTIAKQLRRRQVPAKHEAHLLDLEISPSIPRRMQRRGTCPSFSGNSDFYGLGIRLGVYMQWISSWLTNTLDPRNAAANHDHNSILILALTIAIAIAFSKESIKPVEAYIMIMICYGFLTTVLCVLGFRLYVSNPITATRSLRAVRQMLMKWWNDMKRLRSLFPGSITLTDIWKLHKRSALTNSVALAPGIRHPALSWAGVGWRCAIGSTVASLSIWLWFSDYVRTTDSVDGIQCEPTVYLFGPRPLSNTTIHFFRFASIIMAIPLFYITLVLYQVLVALYNFTIALFTQEFVAQSFKYMKSQAWRELTQTIKIMLEMFASSALFDAMSLYYPGFTFWSTQLKAIRTALEMEFGDRNDRPTKRELAQAYLGILTRGIEHEAEERTTEAEEIDKEAWWFSILMRVLTFAAIALFILFIEGTISCNNIVDVNTIQSTGQLIPFIIGIASSLSAVKDILLRMFRRKFSSCRKMSFQVNFNAGGFFDIKLTPILDSAGYTAAQHPGGYGLQDASGRWYTGTTI